MPERRKKTGGRVAGTPNKRTVARQQEMQEAIQKVVGEVPEKFRFSGNAVALMTAVYKDKRNPMSTRIEAAKYAAQYESPKLQTTTVVGGGAGSNPVKTEGTVHHKLDPESAAIVRKLIE